MSASSSWIHVAICSRENFRGSGSVRPFRAEPHGQKQQQFLLLLGRKDVRRGLDLGKCTHVLKNSTNPITGQRPLVASVQGITTQAAFCYKYKQEARRMVREPLINSQTESRDDDRDLRPQRMRDMVGQREVYARLEIAVDAASKRGEPLGHILFDGPPGLGKTTFATCIPRDLGVGFQIASGAALAAPKDLIPYLTNAEERSVLFIDEIHRLPKAVEEFLYPAMEDFRIDLTLGEGRQRPDDQHVAAAVHADRGHDAHRAALGPAARPLPDARAPRLLHGRGAGRDRPPQREEAAGGDRRRGGRRRSPAAAAARRGWPTIGSAGSATTPRARPTAGSRLPVARDALEMQGIDPLGLDPQDRKYLETIARVFVGGPVGVEAVAHTMNLATDTLIDEVEPFLLRSELVIRTPRGRRLTPPPSSTWDLPCRPSPGPADSGRCLARK